jgi:hypothetical protein
MTVQEIINLAQSHVQEAYETPVWISYINAALDDLTPVAKLLKSKDNISVTPTNGKAVIDLASDPDLKQIHEVVAVYYTPTGGNIEQLARLPFTDNTSKGWKRSHDTIILQNIGDGGTVRVDYYKKLSHVSSTADVPELPEQYHNLLVLYVCAKSQQREEELNDKNDFYSEYLLGKQAFALDRIWEIEPWNRKFIRRARIAAMVGALGSIGEGGQ